MRTRMSALRSPEFASKGSPALSRVGSTTPRDKQSSLSDSCRQVCLKVPADSATGCRSRARINRPGRPRRQIRRLLTPGAGSFFSLEPGEGTPFARLPGALGTTAAPATVPSMGNGESGLTPNFSVGNSKVVTTPANPPRRTQAERSAVTRARILDAAIECLQELGYARTSTPEIARRAGVSRSGQVHQFPTKVELVTSAVERLLGRRRAEFIEAFAQLPAGTDPSTAAIDLLWSMVQGPTFGAWLELVVAARSDDELRPAVASMTNRLRATIEETFRALFPAPPVPNPFYDVAPRFAFALLDGLALARGISADPARITEVLDALKQVALLVMPQSTQDPRIPVAPSGELAAGLMQAADARGSSSSDVI
jgi:AcrR family transcriptional regulator